MSVKRLGMEENMKKKSIALGMAVCLCVGIFTGCGKDGEGAQTVQSEQGGQNGQDSRETEQPSVVNTVFNGELERDVTIQVLENDTAVCKGYFAELIEAFNEKYAEYGIKAVDANMDQYLDLANDGPYGYGPDVLYQANDIIMQYAEGKHIYPLPVEKMECFAQVPETAWAAYRIDLEGTVYTCTFTGTPQV